MNGHFSLFHLLGRFITTYSAILLILVAFVEAQINFCFLSRSQSKHKKEAFPRKTRRPQQYVDNDQNADLEYVIPKVSRFYSSIETCLSDRNLTLYRS